MHFRIGVLLCALLFAVRPSGASAQIASGDLTGRVSGSSGQPRPGLTVTVINEATGLVRTVTTASDGGFTVPGLMPGSYRIEVRATADLQATREHLVVTTGQKTSLDIVLESAVTEQVKVVAQTTPLRTDASSLGAIVETPQVEHVPLNGRTFITLAALAPGVALPPGSLLPRINGGRPRTNEYLFDGISVLQPEPGQVAFFPIIDAIDEFRVESNSAPAEFGRFNGGVINLTTRSGTNGYQGAFFEFARHEDLNARNYFQKSLPATPEYRRSQFGGTFGGPLVRNRTFFFLDYQGQRQSIARTVTSTVPTVLQRQGIFTEAIAGKVPVIFDPNSGSPRTPFAGNTIPMDLRDPIALSLLERYPLPTKSGTANNYQRTALEGDDQDQWDARLDHRFQGDRDHFFLRVSQFHDAFVPVTPLPEGSGVTTGTLGPQDSVSWSIASHYQRTFGTAWVNEIRVGDTRRKVSRTATELPTAAGDALGIPGLPSNASFANVLPTFAISGYTQLGSPPNTASSFDTGVTEVADSLMWLHGRHSVKAGLDLRWERLNVIQPPSPTGVFTFNTLGSNQPGVTDTGTPLASFLLGQVQQFSIDLQQETIQERAHIQEYFIQDDWRMSSRLTMNAGVRYTLNFPSTEINGQTAVFNLDSQVLEYPGTAPVRPLKKDNFGPRLGLVYQATDKTVFSAGYGLIWIEMAGITTPFTTPTFPFLQTVTQRSLDSITPAFVLKNGPSVAPIPLTPTAGLGQGVFAVDANLGSGYVQQWNVSAQRQIAKDTTLEVAYVGSRITHVGIPDSNLNQLTVDQLAMGSVLLQSVDNPFFGTIPRSSSLGDPKIPFGQLLKPYPEYTTVSLYRNNVGETNYKGLEVSVRRRLSHGLLFSASYTRSKLTDTASSVFDASILTGPVANFQIADSHDLSREVDYSTGDIPHAFVSSVVWDLPWGTGRHWDPAGWVGAVVNDWNMTGLVTVQSGVPVAVTQVTNFNAFAGFGTQRPNLNGNPQLPADQRNSDHWFDTSVFSIAPQFTLGSASRNPVRGPSYRNLDLAIARTVPVRSDTSLELRVEIFNALNNVQLGAPLAVAGAGNFGTIITAFDPRVIQVAVKLHF